MAFKEDSPPVVLDPDSLETLDDYYTFGGKLTSLTFTAHPKIDSETGELIAFGYEARGEASDDVAIIHVDPRGKLLRETWIKVPYAGMIHDFAVTQKHVALLVVPMATDVPAMKQRDACTSPGDPALPTWLGVMRPRWRRQRPALVQGPRALRHAHHGLFQATATGSTSTWTWA
jgi:carotenoid cleavage dioxygenase